MSTAPSWGRVAFERIAVPESAVAVAFSPDSALFALGAFDGTISVRSTSAGLPQLRQLRIQSLFPDFFSATAVPDLAAASSEEGSQPEVALPPKDKQPIAALAFRPGKSGTGAYQLLVVSSAGHIVVAAGAESAAHFAFREDDETNAAAYNADGSLFATAGRTAVVRLYNSDTGAPHRTFHLYPERAFATAPAPTRLTSLAWDVATPYFLYTGGWGSSVWRVDTRNASGYEGTHAASAFGPMLMGSGIAVLPGPLSKPRGPAQAVASAASPTGAADGVTPTQSVLVTAAYRADRRLELWDAGTMRLLGEAPWARPASADPADATSCLFFPVCVAVTQAPLPREGALIAVCGGGGSGARDGGFIAPILRASAPAPLHAPRDAADAPVALAALEQPGTAVLCCAFAPNNRMVVFGDADGTVHAFAPMA
jgi:WD40 repeat protein